MIRSMTGYGSVESADHGVSYTVEIKSVNNRFLKLSIKIPESLQYLENEIDKILRSKIYRGSVSFSLRMRYEQNDALRSINMDVMQQYIDRLAALKVPDGTTTTLDLAAMTQLPGVCESPALDDEARNRFRAMITKLTHQSMETMIRMRDEEGQALYRDLEKSCNAIRGEIDTIRTRAPLVIQEYHERLHNRVSKLMQESKLELEADALAREIAIYAERCDIEEELTRLNSHLEQFDQVCQRVENVGRTLEFLTQELLREANTIASKSNDATICRSVVEIKGQVDRLKEQAQNVE